MDKEEIQKKVLELQKVMLNFKKGMREQEKELFRAISDYQKALEEEKLKEIRESLTNAS